MTRFYPIVGLLCLCYFISPMRAQSSLILSSANALPGAQGSLALSLSAGAGSPPTALQWTFAYPSGVTGLTVSAGPALLAAGKSINCAGGASSYTCVASGLNSTIIASGVIGTVSFGPPGTASVPVAIPNALAVSPAGSSIQISTAGGVFTQVGVSALQCVTAANGATCTLTLSGAAPAGGAVIHLSSADPALSVPASIAIPGGAISASFAATATPVPTPRTAQITASLGASTASSNVSLSPPYPSVFQIQGKSTEVSGVRNGSTVTPEIAPGGLTGSVVVNGTGSVNFTSAQTGGGLYFLNCCTNSNNAYYKFTGAAIGGIFNTNQGQISFTLQSRYSFAQRQASAWSPRYAFDVRDGNGTHLFYFLTQVTSGYLYFTYDIGGSGQNYWAPKGTEDTLFGSGVTLAVTLSWSSSGLNLYLNGALVKSTAYSAPAANWTSASNFDLGAYEYLNFGGYYVSDDVIGDLTVSAPLSTGTHP
jgi:hypothetical protein